MIITYLGLAMIKLQAGETVVAINPISKDGQTKAPRFGADLALISLPQSDYNGAAEVAYGDKTPVVIDSPGEYEIGGAFIHGLASSGPADLINTIYALTFDGMNIVHLGALAKTDLPAETLEALGTIDILFVPVGGNSLGTKDAARLAAALEPKIIIPVFLANGDSAETLKQFMKEAGVKDLSPLDKLTLRKKELEGKEGEVVILTPA